MILGLFPLGYEPRLVRGSGIGHGSATGGYGFPPELDVCDPIGEIIKNVHPPYHFIWQTTSKLVMSMCCLDRFGAPCQDVDGITLLL